MKLVALGTIKTYP